MRLAMSALGEKQTIRLTLGMSALPPEAKSVLHAYTVLVVSYRLIRRRTSGGIQRN
jgi:hypothetical protein